MSQAGRSARGRHYGADPFVYGANDPSPLREAGRSGEAEIFGLLIQYEGPLAREFAGSATFLRTNCAKCAELVGAGAPLPRRPPDAVPGLTPTYDAAKGKQPTPIGATPATAASIRAAVERSLPARELIALQCADGGWAQQTRMVSDAYATGEALVALRTARAAALSDPPYRKGVEFLLRTQYEDGTWFLETRSVPIQAYFESGFPYGVDQWISAAATAWATTALAMTVETAK